MERPKDKINVGCKLITWNERVEVFILAHTKACSSVSFQGESEKGTSVKMCDVRITK